MAEGGVTVRTRKLIRNPLLKRRQFMIEVVHPGQAPIAKEELKKQISDMHPKAPVANIVVFGFKTKFGGGKSTGFGLIYDTKEARAKYEPRWRLMRNGLAEARSRTRKAWKDQKRKIKRTWGTGRRAALHKQKRAAAY